MQDLDPMGTLKPNHSQGKIIKGTINDADFKISSSSIPSKFQSIITRSQTISAFGSGVNRFMNRNNAESPGPGAYNSRNRQSPSLSKKGYGPLVSKLDRSTTINKMKSVPGPGAYSTSNLKQPTAKFGKSERTNQIFKEAVKHIKEPGPGAYENVRLKGHSSLYTSIFKSNVKRNMQFLSDAPNPTTYRPKINTFDGRSFSIRKPNNIVKKQNVFNSYFGAQKEIVGPGSYDPVNISSPNKNFAIKETTLDRFGHLKDEYRKGNKETLANPGPGAYTPALEKSTKKLKSMFASRTQRNVFNQSKQGPLYYAYQTQTVKKDFHMNPQQKWM